MSFHQEMACLLVQPDTETLRAMKFDLPTICNRVHWNTQQHLG